MEKNMSDLLSNSDELEQSQVDIEELYQGVIKRDLKGKYSVLLSIISISLGFFQLYFNSYGTLMSIKHGAIFLSFILALIFIIYPINKKGNKEQIPWFDYLFVAVGVGVGLYLFFTVDALALRGLYPNRQDIIIGTVALIVVLEATRRAVGVPMLLIPLIFILYFNFGQYIPGPIGHPGFSWRLFITRMYLVEEGMFGITARVAFSFIYMFVLFGAFLKKSGVGQFLTDFALCVSGGAIGGPAKVAVTSSAMMGMISGSGVANVATTGSFTIPMMKKTGFPPVLAGAVEAVASSGGLLVPPVMGAAAFLIAEFLGISYSRVMIAAIIPALLYYLAVYTVVHFEAKRLGLRGVPREERPAWKDVIKRAHLILPIFIIIFVLLSGYTPLFAAFLGIISTIILSWLRRETRMGIKDILEAIDTGSRAAIPVSIACIVSGIIVGVVTVTALGNVVTYNVIRLSGGILFIAMLFVAMAGIVLSMGLPGTAAYIIVATVAAPALTRMGVNALSAHMFVFYFALLSNITPPVCLASYTAAGIAEAPPGAVAWKALRIAFSSFIIPFMFVFSPSLLFIDFQIPRLIFTFITAAIGVTALSIASGAEGLITRFRIFERLIIIGGSVMLIQPGGRTDIFGFGLIFIGFFIHWYRSRKIAKKEEVV